MASGNQDAGHADAGHADAGLGGAVAGEAPAGGTGDAEVDRIVARLSGVEGRPLRDQVEVFEQVHGDLQDFMADTAG